MGSRRLSRGTPHLAATAQEQEARVKAIDASPEIVADIEQTTGKAWSTLSFGEKLIAYDALVMSGVAIAPVVAALKVKDDLHALAAERTGEIGARDRLALVEQQLSDAITERERLRGEVAELRSMITAEHARPAMAVHSDDRAAS